MCLVTTLLQNAELAYTVIRFTGRIPFRGTGFCDRAAVIARMPPPITTFSTRTSVLALKVVTPIAPVTGLPAPGTCVTEPGACCGDLAVVTRAAPTLYLSIDARRATADAVRGIVPAVATDVVAAALARVRAVTALW